MIGDLKRTRHRGVTRFGLELEESTAMAPVEFERFQTQIGQNAAGRTVEKHLVLASRCSFSKCPCTPIAVAASYQIAQKLASWQELPSTVPGQDFKSSGTGLAPRMLSIGCIRLVCQDLHLKILPLSRRLNKQDLAFRICMGNGQSRRFTTKHSLRASKKSIAVFRTVTLGTYPAFGSFEAAFVAWSMKRCWPKFHLSCLFTSTISVRRQISLPTLIKNAW
jgi:hypothetical protein